MRAITLNTEEDGINIRFCALRLSATQMLEITLLAHEPCAGHKTREVNCSNSGIEPECTSWQGSDQSAELATSQNCEVSDQHGIEEEHLAFSEREAEA